MALTDPPEIPRDEPVVAFKVEDRWVSMSIREVVDLLVPDGTDLPKGFEETVEQLVLEADDGSDNPSEQDFRELAQALSEAEYEDGDILLSLRLAHETALQILCAQDAALAEDALAHDPGDPNLMLRLDEATTRLTDATSNVERTMDLWQAKRAFRARLGKMVETFRAERGMSREHFAGICGLSVSTVKILETSFDPDKSPTRKTKTAIEKVFGWEPGSFDAVLDGEEPTLRPDDDGSPFVSPGPQQIRISYRRAPSDERLFTLRLEPALGETLERLAYLEGRNVNDVIEEAIDLYWRLKGPRPEVGKP